MKVPWKNVPIQPSGSDSVVVQVSRLELKRLRDVSGFLIGALRIRRSVLRADGAVGMSLIAHPLKRTFWTLSAWRDEDAIGSFLAGDDHRAVMTRYRARLSGSEFHSWPETATASLPPDWGAAQNRLRVFKEGS